MEFKFNLRYVRYILFGLSFLIFTFAMQNFVQNFNMNSMIKESKKEQLQLSGQTFWMKNYREPFLKSKYSKFISQHSYGIAYSDEIIIKFKEEEENIINKSQEKENNQSTEMDSNTQLRRNEFFKTFFDIDF